MNDTDTQVLDRIDQFSLGKDKLEIELKSLEDNQLVIQKMLSQTQNRLSIFSNNLDPRLFNQSYFSQECRRIALSGRFAKIEILLMHSRSVIAQSHRLLDLARTLSSHIEIRKPGKQFEHLNHCYILFDQQGYIYRNANERYEGISCFADPRRCRELEKNFATIWQVSHVDPEIRGLKI